MKGFKFKLDAVLKVRKLKEDQCKMELGRLQVEKQKRIDEIKKQNLGIDKAYGDQESTVQKGATGLDLRFYPYFMQGKRTNIMLLEQEIAEIEKDIAHKNKELIDHRANVKVLESMKEKQQMKYKKELNKKIDQDIEEQVMNWMQFKKANL